jgi:Holliday junction resolvasome RuvABC endonuclease subunit
MVEIHMFEGANYSLDGVMDPDIAAVEAQFYQNNPKSESTEGVAAGTLGGIDAWVHMTLDTTIPQMR